MDFWKKDNKQSFLNFLFLLSKKKKKMTKIVYIIYSKKPKLNNKKKDKSKIWKTIDKKSAQKNLEKCCLYPL